MRPLEARAGTGPGQGLLHCLSVLSSMVLALCLATSWAGVLHAQSPHQDNAREAAMRAVVETTAESLVAGRIDEALSLLEEAADRGLVHPDLSFNRGLAYTRRAESPLARPGDFGQAAAGFAEAASLRADDAEAERGLEEAQLAVARRDAQAASDDGAASVGAPLGLLERALLWMSPDILFGLAAFGSAVATVGLLLRRVASEGLRVAASVAWPVGLLLCVPMVGLFAAREVLFAEARAAVVVVREAAWVDAAGRRRPGEDALSETTVVYVTPAQRGLVRHVELGEGRHLRADQLRVVSHAPL